MNNKERINTDVLIIGAGAAGLMAAIQAASRKKKVLVLEKSKKLCEKIRISGGGRCNFTNLNANPEAYISQNPHFCKSALSAYTPLDFLRLIEKHRIKFHEKKLGQLFCDEGSEVIIKMLLSEAEDNHVRIIKPARVEQIIRTDNEFIIHSEIQAEHNHLQEIHCKSLIIATGGLAIPQIGASDFGYKIAKQFDLKLIEPKAALVPLMSLTQERDFYKSLSGTSLEAIVKAKSHIHKRAFDISFQENILFTHRGLSGPAILQISSYINDGDSISINLLSKHPELLKALKQYCKDKSYARKSLSNILKLLLNDFPDKFLDNFSGKFSCGLSRPLAEYSFSFLENLDNQLRNWEFTNLRSEGFNKAEVTRGGIDTNDLQSKTLASKAIPNLYFIGEVVDVTGWLGGYNFQWAWSSGFLAGQYC